MSYLDDRARSGLPDPYHEPQFYDGVVVKRAFAWLVDLLLVTFATFLLGILTLSLAWFFWPLAFLFVEVIYRVSTVANQSATWGMRLMGIELRDHHGRRFDGGTTVLHLIGYYASISFVLPALASVVAMLVTDRRQGLTDLLLGSAAINRPA
ncbi:RDD family protein [Jannaschia seohaensis]|uniref:RDD family protein n=1 Tax=Jannaschia seohaensis TaxID=475081 RepID=A0A2Y9AJI8_9RHOB|nr:RDD family protein [Jannaschia seohaensis]PWJ20406.1 RDD family protein [Jannaschia seohaensis]SSA44480.1 RDD family protein [Jannaschia seohaensis]